MPVLTRTGYDTGNLSVVSFAAFFQLPVFVDHNDSSRTRKPLFGNYIEMLCTIGSGQQDIASHHEISMEIAGILTAFTKDAYACCASPIHTSSRVTRGKYPCVRHCCCPDCDALSAACVNSKARSADGKKSGISLT